MFRRELKDVILLNAVAATGGSTTVVDVADFRDVVLLFATSGTATLTVKVQGGLATVDSKGVPQPPTFTSAASISNPWDYIQTVNLNTGDPSDGDAGIIYAGTDAVEIVEVNTNLIDYLTVTVTSRSAGSVTCKLASVTNL